MTGKETPVPCVDHCITGPVNLLRRALLAVAIHGPARLQKEPSNASARLQWYGQITAVWKTAQVQLQGLLPVPKPVFQ